MERKKVPIIYGYPSRMPGDPPGRIAERLFPNRYEFGTGGCTYIPGFTLAEAEGGRPVGKWIQGDPQVPWTRFGVKIAERAQYPIQTYRCVKCGYLESYARA